VLLTASRRDPLLFQVARQVCEMAGQIEGARLYLHDEGEHPLMWSRPGVFRHVADHFLSRFAGETG
jgi:hypothetical protein